MIKKVIIFLLSGLLLLAALILYSLPFLIRKDAIRAEITDSFKQTTGLDIDIQGDISVVSYPSPHVVINFLDVHSPPEASAPFLLEIKMLEAWPSITGLIQGRLVINKINVRGVDIELECMKNDEMNWKESALLSPNSQPVSGHSVFTTSEFTVSDATVRYVNTAANTVMEFDNISAAVKGSAGGDRKFQLNMRYRDKLFSASGYMGEISQLISTGIVPSNFNIRSGKSFLGYEGDFGFKDKHPVLKGKLNMGTDDIVPVVALFFAKESQKISEHKALPLKISSDVTSDGDKIILPNIVLDGDVIKGNAQAALSSSAHVDIKALIDMFDLETLLGSELFDVSNSAEPASSKNDASASVPTKSVFDSLTFDGDVKVADTLYNGQHIKDVKINFDEAKGEVNVPQVLLNLPGDSRVVFTGIGKQGYQGFIWEGEINASGNDFAKMVSIFKTKGFALPTEDFKRFRFKANAALSSKDMRFSEIAARIENIEVLGGIIAIFGERTKIGAALRIGGVNLDHFITLWGIEEWRNSLMQENFTGKKEIYLSQWLKQMDYDLTLNTSLEQTVLQGKLRDRIDLKLEAMKNNLVLKNLKINYNGTQLSGDLGINISQDAPRFNFDLAADVFDVNDFFGIAPSAPSAPAQSSKERWTHNQFDFHWLGMVNSDFHFRTGTFKYGIFQANDVDIKGNIKEHVLTVDSLSGTTMGASISAKSVITGGKIPTVTMAAILKNINMDQLDYLFPGLQGITGNYNMTMNLNTNGTDTFSWVSNLSGAVALGGRDITVHGFNMLGIISAINYVRTVADILDVVKRAWPGGNTLFSTLQGEWIITNGVLKPSNMKLLSSYADGLVEGQVDLVNWRTQSSITFLVKSLDAVHPPKMVVSYSGNLDAPERMLDTRSLEQYVTNKTSEKLLNQYGH